MAYLLELPATGCEFEITTQSRQTHQPLIKSRNNFIVGQVTPDMLTSINYGTYILFGLLTYLGAAFIWFIVPETKRLSLEEMVCLRHKP